MFASNYSIEYYASKAKMGFTFTPVYYYAMLNRGTVCVIYVISSTPGSIYGCLHCPSTAARLPSSTHHICPTKNIDPDKSK